MPNIEKLSLCLMVENRSEFIDATHLYNEIIIHMPRITRFLVHIITMDNYVDLNYWLKNDDMKERYIIDHGHPYIYCCIDYFTNGIGRCRISSLPLDY